jgi:16S rRNA processing protein RimM
MRKINIGQIVRPFGLKGEVKVKLFTDFPEERFSIGMPLYLSADKGDIEVVVASFRMHQRFALVSFEGKPKIEDIEGYRNYSVSIDEERIVHQEDDVYYFDLIDCVVVNEKKEQLGTVTEVIDSPAHAILRVKREGKDLLIPYVDAFILDDDVENKIITVRLIEGMI